jgi:D-methionine transport system substrate-binding protein
MTRWVWGVWVALYAFALGSCQRPNDRLKIGVIAGFEEEVAGVAVRLLKERYGVDAELISFSDYMTPNAALADGSLDANAFQHRPYLEQQIKDRGYKLVPIGKTFVYPIAAYSRRIQRTTQLADGAQVAVPNDPTNLGRALALLEKQGLLKLKPGVGVRGTALDITDNPRKLRIVEIDAAQLPRALPDVDLAIINTNYSSQIGLVPTRDGLFIEDKDSPYVNLIVVREADRARPALQSFVKAYQSEQVAATAQRLFKGGAIQGW